MSDKDDLKDDLEAFKRTDEAESDQRKEALDMLKFVKLGEQWPTEVEAQRAKEGRPCLVINRLPAFGKQVTNDARQNRPMIKTHPVGDKADRETSEILNGLIRNIEYTSNADVAYDTALDFAVNSGIGYTTVNIDYADTDSFDKDIRIDRVDNPFAIYGDPDSKAADSSDWNSAFVVQKMTKHAFETRWPDAQSSGFDLSDINTGWFDDDKIQVAERWSRILVPSTLIKLSDGSIMAEPEFLKLKDILDVQGVTVTGTRDTQIHKVVMRIITGVETLETNPWVGRYIPIVPCYGDEVNVDGKRSWQSLFHFAKDAQRNYNYHRSMITELGALAPKTPFIGPVGAFDTDIDKWTTANNQAHAFIGYDGPIPPQRQGFAGPPPGVMQEALAASDDMKTIMGLYDASLGARSNETSGKAILARQREGDVSTFNFIDNQSRMIRHLGRILVDLIPKVYDVPRIVRCIKEDGTNYAVPVNQPVQVIQKPPVPGQPNVPEYRPVDPNAPPQQPQGQAGPQGQQGAPMQPGMQQQPMPPQISPEQSAELSGLIKTFDLAAGKYDVTCESGPSFTTRREESANQMMQFVQAFPAAAPVIGDLIAKSLDWPGSDEIAKRLQGMLPPGAQGQNPQLMQAQQAIQQLQQQLGQALQQLNDKQGDMQLKQGELQIKGQDSQLKMQELQIKAQELQIKQFEAETRRMAEQSAMGESQANVNIAQQEIGLKQFDAETKRMSESSKAQGQLDPADDGVQFEMWRIQQQQAFDEKLKLMDIAGRLLVSKGSAKESMDNCDHMEMMGGEMGGMGEMEGMSKMAASDTASMLLQAMQSVQQLAQTLAAPKQVIRDENGRVVGVQQVTQEVIE